MSKVELDFGRLSVNIKNLTDLYREAVKESNQIAIGSAESALLHAADAEAVMIQAGGAEAAALVKAGAAESIALAQLRG